MKFTLGWLKEHLETEATVDQVADTLNAIGLEVEGIENPAEKLSAFRIAKVLTAAPHPQADAQGPERRTHRLGLVVRTLRIVGGITIERFAFAGRLRGRQHLVGAGMAAKSVGGRRGSIDRAAIDDG